MERTTDFLQAVGGVGKKVGLRHSAQSVRCQQQQAVVRADEVVAATGGQDHGSPVRPNAGIDHGQMDADRNVRQGGPQERGALRDGVASDFMANVEQPGIGDDAQHDALADRHRWIGEPEVGGQGYEWSGHRRGSYPPAAKMWKWQGWRPRPRAS